MYVCAVANNGWISIVKVSIGAYGYSASRKVSKDPQVFLISLYMTPPRGLLGGGGWVLVWYWGGKGELISGEFIDVIVLVFRVIGRGILVAQDIDVWC